MRSGAIHLAAGLALGVLTDCTSAQTGAPAEPRLPEAELRTLERARGTEELSRRPASEQRRWLLGWSQARLLFDYLVAFQHAEGVPSFTSFQGKQSAGPWLEGAGQAAQVTELVRGASGMTPVSAVGPRLATAGLVLSLISLGGADAETYWRKAAKEFQHALVAGDLAYVFFVPAGPGDPVAQAADQAIAFFARSGLACWPAYPRNPTPGLYIPGIRYGRGYDCGGHGAVGGLLREFAEFTTAALLREGPLSALAPPGGAVGVISISAPERLDAPAHGTGHRAAAVLHRTLLDRGAIPADWTAIYGGTDDAGTPRIIVSRGPDSRAFPLPPAH